MSKKLRPKSLVQYLYPFLWSGRPEEKKTVEALRSHGIPSAVVEVVQLLAPGSWQGTDYFRV